mmetsp:Transcript_28651/g.32934  ORF Transcript_28651/g.32934 Transcript_28651/m.32934 type:complete len:124 (-) Transcript_28651:283-654(-)|eukprot:CAMPEP_0194441528 /NCGR_PEP_ID=MMETSP0176-20130528/122130_1 /TAXON_ID=216777 /ORGANISM="Proboscia alata, Strain PI-D3" /LENGTH=123 /DNA_ID=CAMNT_0039266973 /DNA_START=121 /DNA_END=492 /DNA_ORIENTATION=+
MKTKIENISILSNDDNDESVPKLVSRNYNNTSTQPDHFDGIDDFFTLDVDKLMDHEPSHKQAEIAITQQQIEAQFFSLSTCGKKTIIILANTSNNNTSNIANMSIGSVSFRIDNYATHHISND